MRVGSTRVVLTSILGSVRTGPCWATTRADSTASQKSSLSAVHGACRSHVNTRAVSVSLAANRRMLSGFPPGGADSGAGSSSGELPSTPLDSADMALRQSLLTRATLRESVGGKEGLLDETKASLQRQVAAEAGLSEHADPAARQADVVAVEKEEPETPLIALLKERMRMGPMPVSEYMKLAMSHPEHGYYTSKGFTGIFGRRGDFTTAPEISQMFGEIIAVWVVWTWQTLGCPKKVQLIELGPGRGTMMADMLRASARFRPFLDALSVHMVDSSEQLQEIQRKRLSTGSKKDERIVKHDGTGVTIHWHNALSEVTASQPPPHRVCRIPRL